MIVTLPYWGSVWHWACMMKASMAGEPVYVITDGKYQRRTHRTRTTIADANGPLDMIVPVESDYSKPYDAIDINNATPWRHQHLRGLMSAYNNTPFYEFYLDDVKSVLNVDYKGVFELNKSVHKLVMDLMGLQIDIRYVSGEQLKGLSGDEVKNDLRIAIEPKFLRLLRDEVKDVEYYQVFKSKLGFVSGLSIVDLLFNMGEEGRLVLKKMAK